MFFGEYKHTVDEKGRIAIPAKFRNMLGEGAVVTRGLDNCLFLYSQSAWQKQAEKMANLPPEKEKVRSYTRFMFSGAMEVEFDSQGRINLPEYLRTFASLKKKAIVAGLFDRLEIWDEEAWEAYKKTAESSSAEIAESLA